MGVRIRTEDDGVGGDGGALRTHLALADGSDPRVLMDLDAALRRRAGQSADPAHRVQVTVVGVRRRATCVVHRHRDPVSRQPARALLDLAPLLIVARDLVRSVPPQLALDPVTRDELANELLRALREPPDAERAVL